MKRYSIATSMLACSAKAYWQTALKYRDGSESERLNAQQLLHCLATTGLYGPRIAAMAQERLTRRNKVGEVIRPEAWHGSHNWQENPQKLWEGIDGLTR